MKREKLRRTLAWAIVEELGTHKRTLPNIDRYVVPKRTRYRIPKSEKITLADKVIALLIVQHVCMQKPIHFQFGIGDVSRAERKKAFLEMNLPVSPQKF